MGRGMSVGDLIQLGILLVSGIAMLGGFWAYCEAHFATKDALTSETEERREMKAEIDALYFRMIPAPERSPLRFKRDKQ